MPRSRSTGNGTSRSSVAVPNPNAIRDGQTVGRSVPVDDRFRTQDRGPGGAVGGLDVVLGEALRA